MKYRILYDYSHEGRYLSEEEYDTINEAVKEVIGSHDDFLIITIIDWVATI